MKITGYGVVLRRLERQDLEWLRQLRNSDEIKNHMFYQKDISAEEQENWFLNLSKRTDFHFVIEDRGERVGLADIKSIDWERGACKGGIFVAATSAGTEVPLAACFCALDYAFQNLGLQSFSVKVRKDNARAMSFNQYLGYVVVGEEGDSIELKLSKDAYFKATDRSRNWLQKRFGGIRVLEES